LPFLLMLLSKGNCDVYNYNLVGGVGHFYLSIYIYTYTIYMYIYIGNVIIPTDELIFFRGSGLNHQPVL
jgi:hypothetical protein